jgi:hypothetical protein
MPVERKGGCRALLYCSSYESGSRCTPIFDVLVQNGIEKEFNFLSSFARIDHISIFFVY